MTGGCAPGAALGLDDLGPVAPRNLVTFHGALTTIRRCTAVQIRFGFLWAKRFSTRYSEPADSAVVFVVLPVGDATYLKYCGICQMPVRRGSEAFRILRRSARRVVPGLQGPYISGMPSLRVPVSWFAGLEQVEPVPRSSMKPPGPPIPLRLRTLSHCRDSVELANRMNAYPNLPPQMRFDFLLHSGALAKRRTVGWGRRPRESEAEQADVDMVAEHWNLSRSKARRALRCLGPDQLAALRDWMGQGGS